MRLLAGIVVAPLAGAVVLLTLAFLIPYAVVFVSAGLLATAATGWWFARRTRLRWPYAIVLPVALGLLFLWPYPATSGTPAAARYWDLPTGSRIAYVKVPAVGTPRSTPVLILHGGPGTPGDGVPDAGPELAAKGFDVYAYDQVGAGRSSRLADVKAYTVARHVADLDAIRQRLGAEKVILVGRSWGGTLIAQYLAAHPDRVERAVLTSPGAIWEPLYPNGPGSPFDHLTPQQTEQVDDLTSGPRVLLQSVLLQLNPAAAHSLVGDAEADSYFRAMLLAAKDTTNCPGAAPAPAHGNLPGFYANQLTSADAGTVPDPRPKLRTVHVPTLIVRGECDYLRPEVTEDYRRTIPGAKYVYVRGAGHSIANGRPELYRSLLTDFLTKG
ncbi:alpha/beta hydrolase [Nonomuraea sediminis]|uniref:alpha/beta hydrolase n=1 Tax=Nonomuraea sediminis TaxID=2835864 RepID=UPI001BDD68E1|nr:alpha/beta hydrolase [Nonomuraea sediminis]